MISNISVEVHCLQPRWAAQEKSKYRIYIDDELMTERDWIWEQNVYIKEHLTAEISPDLSHTVRVVVIKSTKDALTQLGLNHLIVNDVPQNSWDGHRDNLSFMLA